MFTVVSFYTPGTGYEVLAGKLIASCGRFSIPHMVMPMKARESWSHTCAAKSAFVLEMVRSLGNIVWIDADAEIVENPSLLHDIHAIADLAFCRIGGEVRSGTIVASAGAIPTIEDWVDRCVASPDIWDQVHLGRALKSTPCSYSQLPVPYCHIWDTDRHRGLPVILHKQASRVSRGNSSLHPDVEEAFDDALGRIGTEN